MECGWIQGSREHVFPIRVCSRGLGLELGRDVGAVRHGRECVLQHEAWARRAFGCGERDRDAAKKITLTGALRMRGDEGKVRWMSPEVG